NHARTLIAYFRQRGLSSGRAEDLAQEVFLKLYQSAARYQPEERFEAYCFRVARNAWIDACRRRGANPDLLNPDLLDEHAPERPDERASLADPCAGLLA